MHRNFGNFSGIPRLQTIRILICQVLILIIQFLSFFEMEHVQILYNDLGRYVNQKLVEYPNFGFQNVDVYKWDWNQVGDAVNFRWQVGKTPFSDLASIKWAWIVYFSSILVLKVIMSRTEALKLKWITAIHNLFLCGLSLIMLLVIFVFNKAGAVGAYQVYQSGGLLDLYVIEPKKATGLLFWSLYLFYLSKFPELLDTVILVLKKASQY